jgi:hypothetical protein
VLVNVPVVCPVGDEQNARADFFLNVGRGPRFLPELHHANCWFVDEAAVAALLGGLWGVFEEGQGLFYGAGEGVHRHRHRRHRRHRRQRSQNLIWGLWGWRGAVSRGAGVRSDGAGMRRWKNKCGAVERCSE